MGTPPRERGEILRRAYELIIWRCLSGRRRLRSPSESIVRPAIATEARSAPDRVRANVLVLPMTLVVTAGAERPFEGLVGQEFAVVPKPCIDRLSALGCSVSVTMSRQDALRVDEVLLGVDGVVLLGGEDVDAARWGGREGDCILPDLNRDALEFAVVEHALGLRIPLLGICRGAEVLNVALGGSLIRDLEPTVYGRHKSEDGGLIGHDVTVSDEFANLAGWPTRMEVASAHHQAINRLGDELKAVAWDGVGLVEAAVGRSLPVLAVQWHPEFMSNAYPAGTLPFAWLASQLRAVDAIADARD
jgi:putative glutamine amidotransferase